MSMLCGARLRVGHTLREINRAVFIEPTLPYDMRSPIHVHCSNSLYQSFREPLTDPLADKVGSVVTANMFRNTAQKHNQPRTPITTLRDEMERSESKLRHSRVYSSNTRCTRFTLTCQSSRFDGQASIHGQSWKIAHTTDEQSQW